MSLSQLTFSEQRSEPKKKDGVANTATLPNEKGKAREVRAAPGSRILLGDRVRVRYALFYMDEGGNFVFHSNQLTAVSRKLSEASPFSSSNIDHNNCR